MCRAAIEQFFNYLLKWEEIDHHPMDKLIQPNTPDKLVPMVSDDELTRPLEREREQLKPNGIKIMIRRRGNAAGIAHIHDRRLRYTLSHVWQREQGNESDLMAIMGWRFP